MPIIKTVGVISKPNAPAAVELAPKLLDWLREQRKFADSAALRRQIEADIGRCATRAAGDAARPIAVGR